MKMVLQCGRREFGDCSFTRHGTSPTARIIALDSSQSLYCNTLDTEDTRAPALRFVCITFCLSLSQIRWRGLSADSINTLKFRKAITLERQLAGATHCARARRYPGQWLHPTSICEPKTLVFWSPIANQQIRRSSFASTTHLFRRGAVKGVPANPNT